jgi:hypothetical protein
MKQTGWREAGVADGGGGGHRKFRRSLPLSGVVQTIVMSSTPGDAMRAVRNVAGQLYKLDREAEALEDEAAARVVKEGQRAAAAVPSAEAGGGGGGGRAR